MADSPGGGHDVPRTISHYTIGEAIGGGGMGTVYRGTDRRDDSPVAVKLLHPHLASDESFRERFEREAHVGALLHSPYVVRLLDYGLAENRYFIVMEYVEGTSLREEIMKGPLEPARAVKVAAQVARALEEAEARGVVHRDIKPDNILLSPRDNVKVADFGIAKQLSSGTLTMPGAFVGTLFYAAPELALGKADNRSDIYSLGATIFHSLTGRPPFRGDALEVLRAHAETPAPMELLEGAPEIVREIVGKCLQKDPEARYQTVTQLAGELEKAHSKLALVDDSATTVANEPSPAATVVEPPPVEELTAATEVAAPSPAPEPAPAPPEPEASAPPPPRPIPPTRKRGMPSWVPAAAAGGVVAVIAIIALVFLGTLGGDDGGGGGDDPAMIGRDRLRRMLLLQPELGPDFAAFTLNPDASGYVTSNFGVGATCPSTETVTPPPLPSESYDGQYESEQSLATETGTFILAQSVDHYPDGGATSALSDFLENPVEHIAMPGCPDNEILDSDDFDPEELASPPGTVPEGAIPSDIPIEGQGTLPPEAQQQAAGEQQQAEETEAPSPAEDLVLGSERGGIEELILQTDEEDNEREFTITAVGFVREDILGKVLIAHFDSPDHQTQASDIAFRLDARIQVVLEEATPTPTSTDRGSATATPSTDGSPSPSDSGGPTDSGGATASGGPTSTQGGPNAPTISSLGCSPGSVKPNETISCSPSVSGTVTSRTWSASGGSPSSGSGTTFSTSFGSSGQKVITFQACNGSSCSASQQGISVSTSATAAPSAPSISSLGCSPGSVTTNQTVSCSPSVSGTVTSRSWSAPGGSPSSGTSTAFSTAFSSAGSKTITLQACNGSACSSGAQAINVTTPVTAAPANFVVSVDSGEMFPDETVNVSIRVSAPSPGLGDYDIDIIYDPNILFPIGCTDWYGGDCDPYFFEDTVNTFGYAGVSGNLTIATITFAYGGPDCCYSDLIVSVFDMYDANDNPVANITEIDGGIEILLFEF